MKRETVGKISSDLIVKSGDNTHSAHEQMCENLTDWDKNVKICMDRYKIIWPNSDFYVLVCTRKNPLMPNVFENYFTGLRACPTPQYDTTLYRYTTKDDKLSFLWVIPSKDTCIYMLENKMYIPPEEWQLLNFVWRFETRELDILAATLNNEVENV